MWGHSGNLSGVLKKPIDTAFFRHCSDDRSRFSTITYLYWNMFTFPSSSLASQPGVGFSLLHNTPPFGGSSEGFVTYIKRVIASLKWNHMPFLLRVPEFFYWIWKRIFLKIQCTCSFGFMGAHSTSYPMGTGVSFLGGKATGAWSWPLAST
jgi:hypothetical protein